MEGHIVFTVSRFKIAYDVNFPQIDLQIQYYCYQNTSRHF